MCVCVFVCAWVRDRRPKFKMDWDAKGIGTKLIMSAHRNREIEREIERETEKETLARALSKGFGGRTN